jgi:hypothetical protein
MSTEQFNEMLTVFSQLTESAEQNKFDDFKKNHKFESQEIESEEVESEDLPVLNLSRSALTLTQATVE